MCSDDYMFSKQILCGVLFTPSLPWCYLKTINKIVKFEKVQPFFPFFFFSFLLLFVLHWHVKGFSIKCIVLRVDMLQHWKIQHVRHTHASFSLDILQTGAVKGLNFSCWSCSCGTWFCNHSYSGIHSTKRTPSDSNNPLFPSLYWSNTPTVLTVAQNINNMCWGTQLAESYLQMSRHKSEII